MASTIQVEIVSAEHLIFSGAATMVFAPGVMGELGIMPKHTPLLTQLRPGEVVLRIEDGEDEVFYVSGGMIEVQPDMVTVLADTVERAKDLDEAEALEAQKRAEEALEGKKSEMDYARAKSELVEIASRLKAIQRLRK